jgi:hypothetical protein
MLAAVERPLVLCSVESDGMFLKVDLMDSAACHGRADARATVYDIWADHLRHMLGAPGTAPDGAVRTRVSGS